VDVGRITTGRRQHLGVGRRSEGKVSTDTEAHRADLAGTFRMRFQIAQRSLCVGIVAGEFFVDFVRVASIRPGLVVWEHSTRFFELMKYFRDDILAQTS
jgi:hypothetical protein